VDAILSEIEAGREAAAARFAKELDGWKGGTDGVLLDREALELVASGLPPGTKADIEAAHSNVRAFADAQRRALVDFRVGVAPGIEAGQRQIPVGAAGCYAPAGRFAHVASVIMTCATARAAGVRDVTLCLPPFGGAQGPHPAQARAALTAGADRVLCLGGVQAVASMAFGLFGAPPADVLAGPGNAHVAQAKRALAERGICGIDVFAGPTESGVLADASADPFRVATDLVGQAEHGPTSKVVLFSTSRAVAEEVRDLVPRLCADLGPESAAGAAWRDFGEVLFCRDREVAAAASDDYALEHLQVMTGCDDWYLERLRDYGSLFLGHGNNVTFGDKCLGPNHTLPTARAGRFTGGLSVAKFLKTVTWSRAGLDAPGLTTLAPLAASVSRLEGMEGHARSADARDPQRGRTRAL